MENYITQLIDLGDPSAQVTDFHIEDLKKIVCIEKKVIGMLCPACGHPMNSKGKRIRELKHPILQDGYLLILNVTVRKWRCPECNYYDHDHFNFFSDFKQTTTLVPLMILETMKDLELSTKQVAERYGISDTYVREIFMTNVSLPRLPLSDVISIDEVYMKYDRNNLYSLVIMDFHTNQIIDLLPNRLKDTVEEYFLHIPLEERKKVKVLIIDMYKPYLNFTHKYFPNADIIIDSFHVISLIITKIHHYVCKVKRKYQDRDELILKEKNDHSNFSYKTTKKSREVKILERYEYFLLKNRDDISYTPYWKNVKGRGGFWFDPESMEKSFMELDSNFEKIRDLKEIYIQFNKSHINDVEGALRDLEEIIKVYDNSGIALFREVAATLKEYKIPIANSFKYVQDIVHHSEKENILRRLSNGPLEGFNVNPKNYKRQSRGVSNYEFTRNRILWATRNNPSILAKPLSRESVHNYTNKKRGHYKKNK